MANELTPNFYGILGPGSRYFKVSSGMTAKVSDASGAETLSVAWGGQLDLDDSQGANRIVFEGWFSSQLRVVLLSAQEIGLRSLATNEWVASLPVTTASQTLRFEDGEVGLSLSGTQVKLGATAVTATPSAFVTGTVSPQTATSTPSLHILQPNFWATLTPQTPEWRVGSGVVAKLNDAVGAQRIVVESGGKLDLDGVLGANTVVLEGFQTAQVTWVRVGQEVRVISTASQETVLSLPVTPTAQTVQFDDRAVAVVLKSGQVWWGAQQVSSDSTGPVLVSTLLSGNRLWLTYDSELDPVHGPDSSQFILKVNQLAAALTLDSVQGKQVCLTLASVPTAGSTVTLSYRDPTAQNDATAVQDVQGNDALSFTDTAVSLDKKPPVFLSPDYVTVHEQQNRLYVAQALDEAGAVTYQLAGTDAALLALAADGTVTLKSGTLGFAKPRYEFTIKATDAQGNVATQNVTTDVNHLPWAQGVASTDVFSITGTARQGQTLSVNLAKFKDPDGMSAGYDLQWWANGLPIAEANNSTYTLTEAEVGRVITLSMTYTDNQGQFESLTTLATAAVANVNDVPVGQIGIDGDWQQGATLVASGLDTVSDADGLGVFAYQWLAGGANIAGATASTLTLTEAQVGKQIGLKLSYTDGHNTSETLAYTAPMLVANVNDDPTGTVALVGVALQGQTLTVTQNLADADGLGTLVYTWLADGEVLKGVSGTTYKPTQAEVGKQIQVTVSYTDKHGTLEAVASEPTQAVSNANDPPSGTLTIVGTASQNQKLQATLNGLADPDGMVGAVLEYQWLSAPTKDSTSYAPIPGATDASLDLTEALVGKWLKVQVHYQDDYGQSEVLSSAATTTAVANVNDLPQGQVWIDGTFEQGQVLVAVLELEDPDGLGAFAYQWLAGGVNIAGATASTLTLTEAQVGKQIGLQVSYTDGHGTRESVRAVPNPETVANVNDDPTGAVALAGVALQGQTLTVTQNLADADGLGTLFYTWLADGEVLVGVSGTTYKPTQAEVGKQIQVTLSYTDKHGTFESVTSPALGPVANTNDLPTGSVAILGTPEQNQLLHANLSGLSDADGMTGSTLVYQWFANGVPIAEANEPTWRLTEAQVGQAVTVRVAYTDDAGTAEQLWSPPTAAVANVNDVPQGQPLIDGFAEQGQTLSVTGLATVSDADGLGVFAYQWWANGVKIAGATAASYTLTEAEVGKTVTLQLSYQDGHGTAETLESAPTPAVANLNDPPKGGVSVGGVVRQGQTLTANVAQLSDADGLGTLTYTWQVGGADVLSGIGLNTYTLTQAEVGQTVQLVVSYTDGHKTLETVTSPATVAVVNVNDPPTALLALQGTLKQGETVQAVVSNLQDPDGFDPNGLAYQWYANGQVIPGANDTLWTLTEAQVGKTLGFSVSYTDAYGFQETLTKNAGTSTVQNLNDPPQGALALAVVGGGPLAQGQTLSVSFGALSDPDGMGTAFSYQWFLNGQKLASATQPTYLLAQRDVEQTVSVEVTYTDGHGTPEKVSASTADLGLIENTNDLPTGQPKITGGVAQNSTLAVDTSAIQDSDGLGPWSYQWLAGGDEIVDATGPTLTLTEAQVGQTIRVRVAYTDAYGTTETIDSVATVAVANVNDPPQGQIAIDGILEQGQTLSATGLDTVSDADGLGVFAYQWWANGVKIAGATATSYTLTEAEVGKNVVFKLSYPDGHGTTETLESAVTPAVANVNDQPVVGRALPFVQNGNQWTVDPWVPTPWFTDADGFTQASVAWDWWVDGARYITTATPVFTVPPEWDSTTVHAVYLEARYTDTHGTEERVASTQVDMVGLPPVAP